MSYTLLLGDSLTVLKTLPANSVQCAITSPPYFGLRDYGTATWEGGDAACDHVERTAADVHKSSTLGPNRDGLKADNAAFRALERQYRDTCGKCGARRIDQQIGIEATPDEFVAKLVEVFREVRRVLHPSGVLFLNLGDSYNGSGGYYPDSPSNLAGSLSSRQDDGSGTKTQGARRVDGLKNKDLLGIPWAVAFALRADGWYLRSAITWCKGNPMPESVTDRCTSATEMVFMLAKSSSYYYDSDAIREPYNANSLSRYKYEFGHGSAAATNKSPAIGNGNGHSADPNPAGRNRRNWWLINSEPFSGRTQTSRLERVERHALSDDTICKVSPDCPVHADLFDWAARDSYDVRLGDLLPRTVRKRNRRVPKPSFGSAPIAQPSGAVTVAESLDLPRPPYSLFATDHNTQDRKTARAPSTNLLDTVTAQTADHTDDRQAQPDSAVPSFRKAESSKSVDGSLSSESTGNLDRNVGSDMLPDSSVASSIPPECICEFYHEITESTSHYAVMPTKLVEPCILAGSRSGDTVLDPFFGSGTVGAVALKHGRNFIGIDLDPRNIELAHTRIERSQPMLLQVTP